MEKVIEQLKAARIEQKITQASLGKRVALPQAHLSKIEAGKTDPRFSSLIGIVRSLGFELMLVPRQLTMAVEYLIEGKETRQVPRWQPDEPEDK